MIITLGDFNIAVENTKHSFMQLHDMFHPINEPTCFQSHDPTCIDNILTNRKDLFKTSKTFESGLSDHHKLVSTIMKSGNFSSPPRKKIYRSYKNFDFECFNTALKTKLDSTKSPTYNKFDEAFCSVLNIRAPLTVKRKFPVLVKLIFLKKSLF